MWRAENNKRHCKTNRIMNVDCLFVGMHYVQKKLIRKNQNGLVNFVYFSLFSKVQHFLDSMLAVTFCVNFWTTVPKSLLGFFEEKLKTSIYVHFGLLCTFSDQKKNYPIHISKVKGRTFRFQQNKYTCLIITNNTRNNRTNDRSKFMEKLKQAIPTK